MSITQYTLHLPWGLSFKDLVGYGITGTVLRLDAVVKHIPPHQQKALSRETRIYQRLQEKCSDHPGFLRFYGAIENGLLLGYAPNGTVRGYMQSRERTRPLPLCLRLRWAEQIVDTVATLHSCSILHGDLSCGNLFLDKDLNVKVGDFAGSPIDGEAALTFYETRSAHPHLDDVTCESEVFALGSCLYEIMAGRPPYSELPEEDIEAAYSKEQYPDVTTLEAYGQIIKKCWAREYDDVAKVLQEIRAENQDRSVPAIQTTEWLATHLHRILPVILLLPVVIWKLRR